MKEGWGGGNGRLWLPWAQECSDTSQAEATESTISLGAGAPWAPVALCWGQTEQEGQGAGQMRAAHLCLLDWTDI